MISPVSPDGLDLAIATDKLNDLPRRAGLLASQGNLFTAGGMRIRGERRVEAKFLGLARCRLAPDA
jgi:hypothetical protein